MGRVTARSSTEFRPQISYQEYPGAEGVEPLELRFDLRSTVRSLKGEYTLLGRYRRRDTYNSEFGEAQFDDFDPETPTDDAGSVATLGTRTDWNLAPRFRYSLSDLSRIEGQVRYEVVSYDRSLRGNRVGYDSPYANFSYVRKMTERYEASVGPYVSRYESEDDVNETTTYGLQLGGGVRTGETSYLNAYLRVERSEVTTRAPVPSESNWGLEVMGNRRFNRGNLRYSAGRFLEASTLGSRATKDEARVQYQHFLDPRLSLVSAVRFTRDKPIEVEESFTNERVFADLSLLWSWTPTWYVNGGYRYSQQERSSVPGSAADHSVFLSVGYRALDPRPRRAQ
jgi:hypothetical protein